LTHVLTIDGRQFSDGKAVHRMLKKLLCLPEYYGGNADALRDVLDERGERIDLRLLSLGGEDTAKTLRKVARVVQDLGGTVIWADEKQERN
jgi:RNAse (barnase) inhibitor barstar